MQAEAEENDMVIIAGTPVKASVAEKFYENADQDEDQRPSGFHGRGGHHGKRGHHGKKRCCRLVKVIMFLVIGTHFWFIKKLMTAQESLETLTGKKDDYPRWGKCGWKKKEKKVAAQVVQPVQQVQQPQTIYVQQPIVEYSAVNTESSINTEAPEIYEERDKEMGYTYEPAPVVSTITFNNQMI